MKYKMITSMSRDCDWDQVDLAAERFSDSINRLNRQEGWIPVGNHTFTVVHPTTGGSSYVVFAQLLKQKEEDDHLF